MSRVLEIPFGELGDMSTKYAMNLCVLRLSDNLASNRPIPNTASFEDARRSGQLFSTTAPGASIRNVSPQRFSDARPPPHVAKDSSFAHWETVQLPQRMTLDTVLRKVVSLNQSCPTDPKNLILKIKVRFSDSSEITFQRADVNQPSTLKYAGFYSPAALATHHGITAFASTAPPVPANRKTVFKSASAAFVKPGATKISALPPISFPNKQSRDALFSRFDPNGNGYLSLAELDKAVGEIWPRFDKPQALIRAYKACDVDGSGLITKGEFEKFLKFLVNYNAVWDMFAAADKSGDKRLSQEEFIGAAKHLEPGMPEAEIHRLFKRVDKNGGGFVLFEEFCAEMAARRPNVLFPHPAVSLKKLGEAAAPALKPKPKGWDRPKPIRIPEKGELKALFERLDPNGNGLMSLAELDKAVLELWPQFNNKPAIMRAYKAADRNGTGFIGKSEFEYFLRYLMHFNNLWAAFADIDTSDDRRITLQEFLAARDRLQVGTELEARMAFQKMDTNRGGYVLFEEFCDWMAKNKAEFEVKFSVRKRTLPPAKSSASGKLPPIGKPKTFTLQMPDKVQMKALFSRIDPNGNGLLSLAELDKGVLELWPQFNNKPAIMRAYKAADRNGTGFVGKSEFEFFLRFLVHYNNLYAAFTNIDTSDDRRISRKEFLSGASRIGLRMSDAELSDLFDEMDKNKGGYVLFNEYCAVLGEMKARKEAGLTN